MKMLLAAAACAAALATIASARAQEERAQPAAAQRARATEAADWWSWSAPAALPEPGVVAGAAPEAAPVEPEEIDVVEAHWMALTMWGEARSGGEAAMRAVGHVIDNRRRAGRGGGWVTDTVSEAWQFSAWNKADPNRARMLDIHALRTGSGEHQAWLAAKRIAGEILAGRSADPTGGALFYHHEDVAPSWSAGVPPTALIGGHLFFRTAR